MRYRGIFFDLFGTLFVYGDMRQAWSDWLTALHDGLAREGSRVPLSVLASACDGILAKPDPPLSTDGSTVFERRMQELCVKIGIDLSTRHVLAIAEHCIEAWQCHISLDSAAVLVLEQLRAKRKLALISNFDHPPHVHALLARHGMARLFDAVVVSGAIGVKKPDPKVFRPALQQTGLEVHEVCYVGDADEDVIGARAAGLRPILIRRGDASAGSVATDYEATPQATSEETSALDIGTVEVVSGLADLVNLFS